MFSTFKNWETNRHQYARDWKARTGGKVMGYFCTYVPEEILYAAGVLPVRILGSHEPQDLTEPHIFGMFCPFCRDCLAQGLRGRYDYLDGIMISQSCLHIRQAFTSWEKHIPVDYSYYLCMPHHVQSPRAVPYLTGELHEFRKSVENWEGKPISDAALREAIEIYDHNRGLLHQLYGFRKDSDVKLSGEEAMEVTMSNQMVDKREHSAQLERVLKELPARSLDHDPGTRLMIVGSEDDDIAFIHMVETMGATIVTDDHCTGTRYFWNPVEPKDGEELMAAIARRYVERPACPTKDWPERTRIPHILKLAKDFDAAGAILIQQKFCDPHELDIPAIRKTLEDEGIRTLSLEFDVTVPMGQFRIRVEAFLEMIGEEDLF